MKKTLFIAISFPIVLQGCALNAPTCEEIIEVKRQEKLCQTLKKQMNDKQHPQLALTARQRFQQACVDLRYYRNDYDTICKDEKKKE